jgi:predicted HTH transcriptional regulator
MAAEISTRIRISKRAVEKQLSKLRISGVFERSGSDKSGYWNIKSSV